MATDKPPARPPTQAKFPGKRRPAPHLDPKHHERVMKRGPEILHLAKHALHPHHIQPQKTK